MLTFTETQTQVLEALFCYRYLTPSQMLQLGFGSMSSIRRTAKLLRSTKPKPLIAAHQYSFTPQRGRIEYVYYLTAAGVQVLAEARFVDSSDLYYQPVSSFHFRDYWHRKYTVDFHIWLRQALQRYPQLEIAIFDHYFDKSGANHRKAGKGQPLRTKTRVDFNDGHYLIPDVNFVVRSVYDPNKQALFSLEMTNGRDTKRVLSKIYEHSRVLESGVLSQKYELEEQNSMVLFLFVERGLMKAVRRRFYEIPRIERLKDFYYFGCLDDARRNVLNCWLKTRAHGEQQYNFLNGEVAESV